ncbi:MAG: hypothetical protein HOP21_02675 [Methylotenera sp.]|nr:hypothetical protein [Methylotenera sp.]
MKKTNIYCIALVFGLTISVSAMADPMTQYEYKFFEDNIMKEYDAAVERCDALSGDNNACIATARANRNKSRDALNRKSKPTMKHSSVFKTKI